MDQHFEVILEAGAPREVWLAARRGHAGASDSPGILNVSPWSSPMSVYADQLGLAPDEGESEAAQWGKLIEPVLLEHLDTITGRTVVPDGRLLRSKDWPWMQCTLDARYPLLIEGRRGGIEGKCTRLYWNWDEGVPSWVIVQVQHQLAVTGWDFQTVAVLFNGNEFKWVDIARDNTRIGLIVGETEKFMRSVEQLEPPPADGKECTTAALRALFPSPRPDKVIPLDGGDLLTLDDEYDRLNAALADHAQQKRAIQNRIRLELGDAQVGLLANGSRWTQKADKNGTVSLRRKGAG